MIQGCGWRSFAIVTNVGSSSADVTSYWHFREGDYSNTYWMPNVPVALHQWEVLKWLNQYFIHSEETNEYEKNNLQLLDIPTLRESLLLMHEKEN